jgi:hypothetical protein
MKIVCLIKKKMHVKAKSLCENHIYLRYISV